MRSAAILAVALLAACSAQPEDAGGVTRDEAQQLNEAAEMLDDNSMDADALTNERS